MKPAKKLLRSILVTCIALSGASASGLASSEVRVVETAPGQRVLWTERQMAEFGLKRHEAGFCGGFFDVTDFPVELAPAIRVKEVFDGRSPAQGATVEALARELDLGKWFSTVQNLTAFHNRFYKSESGVASMRWVRDRFAQIGSARADFSVELVPHEGFPQPSVIARLRGRGPLAEQRVVLGAHGDSINWASGGLVARARAPGADDDASGVASVLEIFRVIVESGYQPDRTLEFMVYAAEERGLLGSQAIARDYNVRGAQVIAALQLDMTAYPGSTRTILLVDDYVNKSLTRFTEMLIDTYVRAPWAEGSCGYACSDHASWTKVGFPSVFPFESPDDTINPHIHTESDTADRLDPVFGMGMVKLGLAFAIELATETGAASFF